MRIKAPATAKAARRHDRDARPDILTPRPFESAGETKAAPREVERAAHGKDGLAPRAARVPEPRPGHDFGRAEFRTGRPRAAGRALPASLRAKMEAAFESDFSAVRVHEDGNADPFGADAFTRGHDIHFAPGKYQPGSAAGEHLIGHELTHVLQQRAGRVAASARDAGPPVNADPKLEAEADVLGRQAARGLPAGLPRLRAGNQAGGAPRGGGVVQGGWWGSKPTKSESDRARVNRELEELRKQKVVQGTAGWFSANPATARNRALEQHLVSSGRAQSAQEIAASEAALTQQQKDARTQAGDTAVARWRTKRTNILNANAQRNAELDREGREWPRKLRRNLNKEELQRLQSLRVRDVERGYKAANSGPRPARKQPGGPHVQRRDAILGRILAGMEKATNSTVNVAKAEADAIRREQGPLGPSISPAARRQRINDAVRARVEHPAHSVSRHGAQTTLSDQAARVVAGYAADQKPNPMPVGTTPGAGGQVQIPNYPNVGPGAVEESSRFGSHAKHYRAVSEAFAQAWAHDTEAATKPVTAQTPYEVRREVGVPDVINGRQYIRYGNWQTTHETRPEVLQPTNRLEVSLAADPESYGESVRLNNAAAPPALGNAGDPLPGPTLNARANALQINRDVRGAQFFMDIDKKRGGFSVQTGYPQPNTVPRVAANYEGEVESGISIPRRGQPAALARVNWQHKADLRRRKRKSGSDYK